MGARGVYHGPQRGILWMPRGVYLEAQTEGYIWGHKGVYFGFPKGYIWVPRNVFFFLEGHVWETHVHTFGVQHDLLIQT